MERLEEAHVDFVSPVVGGEGKRTEVTPLDWRREEAGFTLKKAMYMAVHGYAWLHQSLAVGQGNESIFTRSIQKQVWPVARRATMRLSDNSYYQ